MKRINWKELKNKIPTHFSVNKQKYEVLWVISFADPSIIGEKRVDPNQIVLKTGESDKETVKTFFHEYFHAIGDEYQVPLTESQVVNLEKSIPDLIKLMKEML